MAQTSNPSTSEFYSPLAEHSQEDIKKVISMAEEEQQRRISDTVGEGHRRAVAGQISDIFSSSLRATWFQKGSSFVLSLLSSVRQSGTEVLNSQPVKNINAKLQIAGQKSVATAQDVTTTVATKAGEVGVKVQETAQTIKDKSIGLAQGIKERGVETAQGVSVKAQGKVVDFKAKGIETAQDAKVIISAQVEKVQELGTKLKLAVTNMRLYKKLNKSFSNLAEHANIAFVFLEEENERAFRMSSPSEINAIYNALKVSQLIKDLDRTFYRPESEPSTRFLSILMEENERARRVQSVETSAINNAKAVSLLILQKNTINSSISTAPVVIAPAKVEIVDEIKVSKPLIATM